MESKEKCFMILEDKYSRLSFAPQNWLGRDKDGREIIYWPKKNQTTLVQQADSVPVFDGEYKWLVIRDKVKRKNIRTVVEAEEEIEEMMNKSVTEPETDKESKIHQSRQTTTIPKFHVNHPQTPPPAFKNRIYVTTPTSSNANVVQTPPSLILNNDAFIGLSPLSFSAGIQNDLGELGENTVS